MKLKLLLLLTRVLAVLPFRWIMALATPLGALLAIGGRRKRVALRNLKACFPEQADRELENLARGHCREFVKLGLESTILWHWPLPRVFSLIREVRGQRHLDTALAAGRGLIFAVPHCGCWEMFSLYMPGQVDFAALYKPSEHAELDALIERQRERSGNSMFPADSRGLRQSYKHLKAGKVLALLPDQQPKAGEGQFAPFFGVQTLTMTLLSKMTQRTGCQVIFATCERVTGGYRMHFLPADPDIYNADLNISLAALNRNVETCIGIAPAQYLWSYKRFSIRPEGEAPFY